MIVFIDYSEVQNAVSGQKCLFLNIQRSIFSLLFFQTTQFILHFSFNITVILPVFFCPDFYVCCAGLEISQNRHSPCFTKIIGMYGKTDNLPWKLSKFSLALQPEALVNTSGRVDFSSPAVCIQMHFGLVLITEASTMNPDQTAPLRAV